MFAVFCWVSTFAGAPTSANPTKSSLKLAKFYKPESPIGPVIVCPGSNPQFKPINDWNKGDYKSIFRAKNDHLSSAAEFNKSIINHFVSNFKMDIDFHQMLEHCRQKIYVVLPSLVIQPDVDPADHTGAISAEIMKMKKEKEFETWDMSQIKRRATFEIVRQIKQEAYQREQVRIEEKHEQQFYHEVIGFIDRYLQSQGHVSNGVGALKEIHTRAESEALDLMQKQSLLKI